MRDYAKKRYNRTHQEFNDRAWGWVIAFLIMLFIVIDQFLDSLGG